jgi:DNA-directed RNA polymerase specialized sigma24 family protein
LGIYHPPGSFPRQQPKENRIHEKRVPSVVIDVTAKKAQAGNESYRRLEDAYPREITRLLARLRAAGRTLEEVGILVHDVYAEILERMPLMPGSRNLRVWIHSLVNRRMIDSWRNDPVRTACGETGVAEEMLREVIALQRRW